MTTNKPKAIRYIACKESLNGISEASDKTEGWIVRYVSEMDYFKLQAECVALAEALEFYANGEHIMFSDEDVGTATVEDGYFAKAALAAHYKGAQP